MTETITPSIGETRRPGLIAVVLLLASALAFAYLGRWQMVRADERAAFEAEAAAAGSLPELDLRTTPVDGTGAYRHAVAEGIYDPAQQFYLEGRRQAGNTGYHVITALRLAGKRDYVLVNRGWIPGTAASAPVPPGRVRVTGVLMRPQLPPLRLGQVSGVTRPYLDPADYARESGREVAPLILVASDGGPGLIPAGLEHPSKQGMHEGYAVQWFAFAAVALIAAAAILRKRLS
jgi:surfeit locus 1 family protein